MRVVAEGNPFVTAAEERWQAMRLRVPQAAAWEYLRLRGESVVADSSIFRPTHSRINPWRTSRIFRSPVKSAACLARYGE
jgi:hypothetical protein